MYGATASGLAVLARGSPLDSAQLHRLAPTLGLANLAPIQQPEALLPSWTWNVTTMPGDVPLTWKPARSVIGAYGLLSSCQVPVECHHSSSSESWSVVTTVPATERQKAL